MINTEKFSQLVDRAIKDFQSDPQKRDFFQHNLTLFLQVNAARIVANEMPVNFDFRDDYWWKAEVRLAILFFNELFDNEFYPPKTVRKCLYLIAQFLKNKRNSGAYKALAGDGGYKSPERFRGDVKIIRESLASGLPELASIDAELKRENRRMGRNTEPILKQFEVRLSQLEKEGKWQSMDAKPFFKRVRYLHYFTAKTEDEVLSHGRFFSAWYTLFTSTNAYQHGGAAQNIGPVFGNSKTLELLETVNKWCNGRTLSETRFVAHDAHSESPIDRSSYTAILELYGFCRLTSLPIVNKSVLEQYRKHFEVDNQENGVIQEQLGKAFTELPGGTEVRVFAGKIWKEYLAKAVAEAHTTIMMEQVRSEELADKFKADLYYARFDKELKQYAERFAEGISSSQKEQVVLQLVVDAMVHANYADEKGEEEKEDQDDASAPTVATVVSIDAVRPVVAPPEYPLNQILYGPPGTGKTYSAVYRALEIIDGHSFKDIGDEKQRRSKAMARFDELRRLGQVEMVTFHPGYSYEDFVEGIAPTLDHKGSGQGVQYEIRHGAFYQLVEKMQGSPHVMIIDEINRGNLSRIFGELITLIEDDKRIGADNQTRVKLAYSGREFGVPANLFIVGTMNSADRSIALMDTALRRRFEFERVSPDLGLIPADVDGIPLREIVSALNQRIAAVLGEDLEIGHAYFLGSRAKNIAALKETWFKRILPLMNEYVYGDCEKLVQLVGGFAEEVGVGDAPSNRLFVSKRYRVADRGMTDDVFRTRLLKLVPQHERKAG